ncbi:S-adenosyl-L-methionine-dependent methyltransferase [Tilletiaria anomala UBC 951]|uniref:S-adenosyl-L-methionine-dependent methyltransferase n=1 Tax=Tilletiaria anomala (strain ATCC 24038 / CBS 436.72 / UBC 951) TaxID=1037660 RepID=A0A066WQV0_TILAU|nr:S-adenosyl-L-methionine-dependent methyltransferase [Tilletiaria anomala UBC 951]KDN53020.1 S-adenosyl-L-methionine-dependent methyltransferase [Tilletiaria anomala UBC 951]
MPPGTSPQTTNPKPGPPKPNSPFTIFDRAVKVAQKDRAASRRPVSADRRSFEGNPGDSSRLTDYVRSALAENVAERLLDIKRPHSTIVEIGSGPGSLRQFLDVSQTKTQRLIMCDSSEKMLYRDQHLDSQAPFEIERRVMDEEFLEFEENSLDCVVSIGSLQWTNDLPGALIQIRRALKPDGVFVGAICGGDTLFELRTSLQLAEQEREGGISARVSPMAESSDMASLLSRAGFNIPTIDVDDVTVSYPSMFELIHDLRDMGESNAIINRRPNLQRDTLLSAAATYQALHGNEDGTIPATFSVIFMVSRQYLCDSSAQG